MQNINTKYNLELVLNNSCNKNCSYCYEKNDGTSIMTIATAEKIINTALCDDRFDKDIMFFGGEPTMSMTTIKHICDKYGDSLTYNIITNGLFMSYDYKLIEFMSKFKNINISLEGTERSFNQIRSENGLKTKIEKIGNLGWNNITINISINGLLIGDEDEFISNVKYIESLGMYVHIYNIKGDNTFFDSIHDYYNFLRQIEIKDKNIYKKLLLLKDNIDIDNHDFEYLCTYSERISVNPNGDLIACTRMKPEDNPINIHNINNSEDMYKNYMMNIAKSHISLFEPCEKCTVPIGLCQVSCKAMIDTYVEEQRYDELEFMCSMEKIRHALRKEYLNK